MTATNTHWHAGWNMVGYLPEMDSSYPFESFEDAKASMIDDMERKCDSLDMATDGDCVLAEDGETCTAHDPCGHSLANELSGVEQDLNLDNGPEWGAIVGYMSYWISECAEEECLEEGEYAR